MDKIYYPLLNVEEVRPLLSKIPIFGGLKDAQLDEIFKLLKTVTYEKGEYIYKRGGTLSYIYIVKQGKVKMKIEEKGVFLDLVTFKKGECFGETSVIGIQSHSSNALAVEPTELIVLEPSHLLNIYERDKEVFAMLILNIARETARRLNQSNEALVQYMLIKDMKLD
jgi:CRP-like cAMP-binding protein